MCYHILYITDFDMLREITNFVRILPPNNMRRILLLICLFVILVTPAVAQLYQYLDTQNGLSSRRVLSIRKDKKGYMWFLTHEGIDRYNGKQYTHYSLTANGKLLNFFPNLNTLQTDTAGVVWEIGKTGRSPLHFLTPKTTIYCFALKTNNIFST